MTEPGTRLAGFGIFGGLSAAELELVASAARTVRFETGQLRALADQDSRFGYALTLCLFQACAQRLQATRARLLDLYRSPK